MAVAVMVVMVHRFNRSALGRSREDGPRERDSRAECDELLHGRFPFCVWVCVSACNDGPDDAAEDARADLDPAVVVVVAVVALMTAVAVARGCRATGSLVVLRSLVMGDLRSGLRHRLGNRGLVGRRRGLVGRLRRRGGTLGLRDLRRGSAALGGLVRGGGESRSAEGDAGDGCDHHLLNCVLVHVAPCLSVFACPP